MARSALARYGPSAFPLLVGHLPFMARLAGRLVAGRDDAGVVAFQPGTILCLERGEQQRWTIAWMVRPDVLPNSA